MSSVPPQRCRLSPGGSDGAFLSWACSFRTWPPGVVDNATSTFDRILEKQTGLGGIKTADAQDAAKMAELEQLRRENRIKERVAAIKSGTED